MEANNSFSNGSLREDVPVRFIPSDKYFIVEKVLFYSLGDHFISARRLLPLDAIIVRRSHVDTVLEECTPSDKVGHTVLSN